MRIPRATYRLQLNKDFTFAHAEALVDYFASLGVSDLYLSPINTAPADSTHNYDVWNYQEINPALGGRAGFESLVKAARARGLGILIDFVPNHMGIAGCGNPWWRDVLKYGRNSRFADFFDICWDDGKVRLPVLGDSLDNVLKRGEIKIDGENLVYFEHIWPICPGTLMPDDPAATLAKQHYEPIFWREGPERINYRRFFEVNTLAGIAVERPHVFEAVHALLFELVNEGWVDGVRIDHIDGLANPSEYLHRLREGFRRPVYLLVEKILAPDEKLPSDWPVEGTTGYDFLFYLNELFVDRRNEEKFTRIYEKLTGEKRAFDEIARESKREVLGMLFRAELNSLVRKTNVPPAEVEKQIVSMDVYREYKIGEPFQTKLQQLTGPVMAKGVEDTAFYRYHRFIGLNEVGGDPGIFGISLEEFHKQCLRRAEEMPHSMLTTSTHDTKVSEDVRARLAVLSEIPEAWEENVSHWMKELKGPDANTQYRFFQALVGTWPSEPLDERYVKRILAFMLKSVREAKVFTNWLEPNVEWEKAFEDYERKVLVGAEGQGIRESIGTLVEKIKPFAEVNSLAQILLNLTCPGVPDIYQGNELWDFSLVDPDNRRPVDYDLRKKPTRDVGAMKMKVTRETLQFRKEHANFFEKGSYRELSVNGPEAQRCVVFERVLGEEKILVVVPRFTFHLKDWGDTKLQFEGRTFRNVFTNQTVTAGLLKEIFAEFPVALLVQEGI